MGQTGLAFAADNALYLAVRGKYFPFGLAYAEGE